MLSEHNALTNNEITSHLVRGLLIYEYASHSS